MRIELHRRFALPVACIMLALVGIPLGIATRKGGKSAGYVNAVFLAFFCYYLALISLIGLAKQSRPCPCRWPLAARRGLRPGGHSLPGAHGAARRPRPAGRRAGDWFWRTRLKRARTAAGEGAARFAAWRLPLLPQIVDTYILSQLPVLLGRWCWPASSR